MKGENGDEKKSEIHGGWKSGLLDADDLILCGELGEDLRVMVRQFVGV